MVHLELHTGDLPQARDLYAELCGWRPEWIETRAGCYLSLGLGDELEGGIVECPVRGPLWLPYVEVDGIDDATDRAGELGASVLLGAPGGPGRMAQRRPHRRRRRARASGSRNGEGR